MGKLFIPNTVRVPEAPYLTQPIEEEKLLLTCQLSQFDREGYELLPIEQIYYEANNIALHTEKVLAHESGNAYEWKAFVQKWFEPEPYGSFLFKLDHSFCVVRYAFAGEARAQIQSYAEKRPELNKLLNIRPKWGADFCVDYIAPEETFELVHWEWDFLNVYELKSHIEKMEKVVAGTAWFDILNAVKIFRRNYTVLDAETEGNFKANLFGLPKAFRLYKSFY